MNLLQNPATAMLSKLFQPDQAQQPAGVQGLNAANPMQQMMQQLFQNRQQTMNTLRAPKRLDIGGNLEDPNAPKGLDWLTAHGPQNEQHAANTAARSSALGQAGASMSPHDKSAAMLFNHNSKPQMDVSNIAGGGAAATPHGMVGTTSAADVATKHANPSSALPNDTPGAFSKMGRANMMSKKWTPSAPAQSFDLSTLFKGVGQETPVDDGSINLGTAPGQDMDAIMKMLYKLLGQDQGTPSVGGPIHGVTQR